MGYIRHHTIVVSSWQREGIDAAWSEAHRIFNAPLDALHRDPKVVSEVIEGVANSQYTFFIAPDGSKEGWSPSDEFDARRAEYVGWLRRQSYVDGSTWLDWAEIQFGDEEGMTMILADSDEYRRAPA